MKDLNSPPSSRRKKRLVLIVALILILAALFFMLRGGSNAGGPPGAGAGGPPGMGLPPGGIKVEATKAVSNTITQKLNIVGNLTSNESTVIRSEVSGRVVAINFKEGSEVKKGDILFRLDDSVQKAELARAQANYSLASNNVGRYGGLVKSGAISKIQLEQSQADLSLGTANIALAKANLAKTTIRAPFSGIAGIRQVSIGDVISNGQNLVNLEQMNPIRVHFSVPEKYLSDLKTGQKVTIVSETQPNDKFEAEIFAIDPRIDTNSRSVAMQALAQNNDKKLYPGQFVSITLPLKESAEAVVIPDQALMPFGNVTIVYTVVNGKVKKNIVKTGMRSNSQVQILEGINVGDMVITAGLQKIQEGLPVRVTPPTVIKASQPEEEIEQKGNVGE